MAQAGIHNFFCSLGAMTVIAGLGGGQNLPSPLAPGAAPQRFSSAPPPSGWQPFNGQPSLQPVPGVQPAADVLLTPQQLDNLVAPVALYPDGLLSQLLAASTYPLEIVDAEQWMQQNKTLAQAQLVDGARQQNWDPSVQSLMAFPDVLDILARDIHWTTELGNAFLAQQADVMSAVQLMRARAAQSGQLRSTPQQTVSTQYDSGQSAIQIAPTDPQTVYVPEYQPVALWGPPAYGAYPSLWYPPAWGAYGGYGSSGYNSYGDGGYGNGGGIGFSPGVLLGNLFNGLLNYGPWGWGVNWFSHALYLIPSFFSHFFGGWWGGHGYGGGGYYAGGFVAGYPIWAHDPGHRLGIPYGNRSVATRFGGGYGNSFGVRANAVPARAFAGRPEAPRASASGGGRGGISGESRGFTNASRASAGNQYAARSAPQTTARGYGGAPQSFRNTGNSFAGNGSFGNGVARNGFAGNSVSGNGYAGNGARNGAQSFRPETRQQQSAPREPMTRSFSAPRAPERQNFSAPSRSSGGPSHFSAPHVSAPHVSAPHASGGSSHGGGGGHASGGGHSSGGHKH